MRMIYEDKDVLVVNKSAGLSVHPANGIPKGQTIEEQLQDHGIKPFLVHRLDKDTSGVLIIAKNEAAQQHLRQQFQARRVAKTYLTLVQGHLEHPEAVINVPVARHPKNPLKRAVRAVGKLAETHYKVLKTYQNAALLEVRPKTGRTHQIRVHLAYLGHPVVGDKLYGKPAPKLKRHFLHAQKLTLKLPNGATKTFTSPLPSGLTGYLKGLV